MISFNISDLSNMAILSECGLGNFINHWNKWITFLALYTIARYPKVLVAIDGSDHSMKAAEYAIDIARDNKAQLFVLTVLDISKVGYALDMQLLLLSHHLYMV
jgi:Universal stress protein family